MHINCFVLLTWPLRLVCLLHLRPPLTFEAACQVHRLLHTGKNLRCKSMYHLHANSIHCNCVVHPIPHKYMKRPLSFLACDHFLIYQENDLPFACCDICDLMRIYHFPDCFPNAWYHCPGAYAHGCDVFALDDANADDDDCGHWNEMSVNDRSILRNIDRFDVLMSLWANAVVDTSRHPVAEVVAAETPRHRSCCRLCGENKKVEWNQNRNRYEI